MHSSDQGLTWKPITGGGLPTALTGRLTVAVAMIRVFIENGDRTDRKKARLKYLIDRWGVAKFLGETQKKLAFPLVAFPLDPPLSRRLGIVRRRDKPQSPALGVLLSALDKLAAARAPRGAGRPPGGAAS